MLEVNENIKEGGGETEAGEAVAEGAGEAREAEDSPKTFSAIIASQRTLKRCGACMSPNPPTAAKCLSCTTRLDSTQSTTAKTACKPGGAHPHSAAATPFNFSSSFNTSSLIAPPKETIVPAAGAGGFIFISGRNVEKDKRGHPGEEQAHRPLIFRGDDGGLATVNSSRGGGQMQGSATNTQPAPTLSTSKSPGFCFGRTP